MRKSILLSCLGLLLVIVAALGTLFVVGPLLTLKALRHDLKTRDAQALDQVVDFSALRINVVSRTNHQIKSSDKHRTLGALRSDVTQFFADKKLREATTPAGLIGLVCDSDPQSSDALKSGKPCPLPGARLHSFRLRSDAGVVVSVQRRSGGRLDLILRRRGLRWQIIDIVGPPAA
jgi:Protein of unknown function (DUF2939).